MREQLAQGDRWHVVDLGWEGGDFMCLTPFPHSCILTYTVYYRPGFARELNSIVASYYHCSKGLEVR